MNYRKEIDGLRAIAILPVLFFHAKIAGFSGGFYGVDIFFVISGYLITSIILDEVRLNKFSIINFYERRARRILPALSFVLFCTTVATFYYMPQTLFQEYLESVAYVSTFTSNVFFYMQTGYFANPTDEMPLMHTWSLAIEEQFYLFFPLLVALIWKFARTYLLPVIFLFTVASLLYSQYLTDLGIIEANFYFIFSRAWELLAGSVIAFFPVEKIRFKGWKREFWSLLGLAMICYSLVSFDETAAFPSGTLLPVIGSCLVILFANQSTLVGRLLSANILIFIGLISYSLYLWHQPLFALIRVRTLGEPSLTVFIIAILASVVLASFSWKFIEAPFRSKQKVSRAAIFKFSAASISLFFLAGLSSFYINNRKPIIEVVTPPITSDNTEIMVENVPSAAETPHVTFPERESEPKEVIASEVEFPKQIVESIPETADIVYPDVLQEVRENLRVTRVIEEPSRTRNYEWELAQDNYFEECHSGDNDYLRPHKACRYFDRSNVSWAILGDSHSNSLGIALAERLETRNAGLLHLSFGGCPPALTFISSNDGCTSWTKEAISYLENNDEIKNVVMTYHHGLYMQGDHLDSYPNLPDSSVGEAMYGEDERLDEAGLKEVYWQSFTSMIARLQDSGKTVYVTFPLPVLPDNIYKDHLFDIQKGASYDYYLARNHFILRKLETLPYGDKLKAINSAKIFCNGTSCPGVRNGRLLYFDDNHLNIYGASFVVDEIFSN